MNQQYILQNSMFDCGVAALKTIFLLYGRRIKTEDIVGEKINQGITALQLIQASQKKGLVAKGVKSNLTYLNYKYLPCIAHVIKDKSYFHYLVILKNNIMKKTILVHDPSIGLKTMTYEEFNDITTEIFIIFNHKDKLNIVKDNRFIKILKELLIINKFKIIKIFTASLIFIFLSLIFNYYLKLVIEYPNYFILLSLTFTFISLIKNNFAYFKNKIIIKLNKDIDKKVNEIFINHILFLPYKYYLNSNIGELMTISSDIENFKNIVVKVFISCFVDFTLIFSVILFMSFYNIYYVLIFFLLVIVTSYISIKYQRIFNQNYLIIKDKKIKNSNILLQFLDAFNSIKNLVLEKKVALNIQNSYEEVLDENYKYDLNNNTYTIIINLIEEIFMIIVVFVAIYFNNNYNIFNVILFSSVFYLFIGFLNNINECIAMYKMYNTSVNKVLDLLEIDKEKFNITINDIFSHIVYQNVSCSFNRRKILKNINFEIFPKDLIFITGKSGVGKSTLIKSLLKYVEYEGKILLDNIDLSFIEANRVRNSITYVSQDEKIFNNTIYNNLKLINDNDKDIQKVIKICQIQFNSNYVLEENGKNISGGERKKILIARALLKNTKIIIFDESFNEIDLLTERKILKEIINNYCEISIILISHRKSNMDLFKKHYNLINGQLKLMED